MSNEIYILIGAIFTGLIGYMAARLTSGVQLRIAHDNSKKDLLLHQGRLLDDRLSAEAALEREKLEELHKILSADCMLASPSLTSTIRK